MGSGTVIVTLRPVRKVRRRAGPVRSVKQVWRGVHQKPRDRRHSDGRRSVTSARSILVQAVGVAWPAERSTVDRDAVGARGRPDPQPGQHDDERHGHGAEQRVSGAGRVEPAAVRQAAQ
ncbi:hypothetical protein DV36_02185 [Amycolatopsis mediterranei]|nr:hypothetical protein DV36_02185 [Amycolatopsis mediterranei]